MRIPSLGDVPVPDLTAPAFTLRKNLVYADHDGVALTGDLYLPPGNGPFPAIVNVHGGYWRRGSRDTFQYWGPYLAARGYAGFTISYRLTKPGHSTFPGVVNDVRAAVQFLRGSADEFGLDPDRIALWGNSAGAHLAAMVALAGENPQFKDAYPGDRFAAVSATVKALVGTYGIYDLFAQWKHCQIQNPGDNLVESLLGCSPMHNRRLYFDASPISYATFDNNRTAVFLIWGTEDDLVDCRTQSLEFLTALKQAEFQVRPCVVHGAPHYWLSDPIDEPGSHSGFVAPRLIRFLQERL
ncbi:MAG: alpha/beta hydrolase [Hyphomicrobiales bacterium]|nr:alpha/beta hydrolase [Hyphomicrobiales bacterium]